MAREAVEGIEPAPNLAVMAFEVLPIVDLATIDPTVAGVALAAPEDIAVELVPIVAVGLPVAVA